jgi:hypothetical protein
MDLVASWASSKEKTKVTELLQTIQEFQPTLGVSEEEAEVQWLSNIQNARRRHRLETRRPAPRPMYRPDHDD